MRTLSAALILTCTALAAADAQSAGQGTLVVRQGGKEVGREEFTLRGSAAAGGARSLSATSRYPNVNPAVQITAQLDQNAQGELAKFVLQAETAEGPSVVYAAGSGARLIIRTSAKGGAETGREMPGGPNAVLLDENVYSLFHLVAAQATPAGARLVGIYPRTGRTVRFTARREGDRVALSGEISGTLALDGDGTIQSIELGNGMAVTRQAK